MKSLLITVTGMILAINTFSFNEEYWTDWYTKNDPGTDADVLFLLDKTEAGGAVAVHEGRIRKRGYYIASPIQSGRGMSFYELTMVCKVEGEWERTGSTLYMCDVIAKDLRHSDERFIRTEEVSLGVVFAIIQSWKKMYSTESFEDLLSVEFIPEKEEKKYKTRFINDLKNERASLKIVVVELIPGRHGCPLYSITVKGEKRYWRIGCDIVGGEMKYFYISEVHL